MAKEVKKHKIKGKRGSETHEQRQLRLLSTQTRVSGSEAKEQMQMMFISARSMEN
jgi:hypothetical protein